MKVDNRLFFEVLIGTYNRPDRAINAIQSALSFNDVIVRCNSNGYEPLLDEYCKNKGNVIYTYFDVNKGACKNWSYLLNSAESEFCMLLSDEDEIDSKYFPDFLDFLRGSEKVAGAIVPFFDKGNDRVMNTIGKKVCSILSKKSLVYRNYSFRGYMSGFIFRTEFVQDVLLNKEPRPLCSRYRYDDYLHVRLLRKMLDYGNIVVTLTTLQSGWYGIHSFYHLCHHFSIYK